MDHSSSMSYTHMLNSSIPSSDPQNASLQHPQNNQTSPFFNYPPPNLQQYHPHNAYQFSAQPSRPQFIPAPSSYQGVPYQGHTTQYSQGGYGGYGGNSPASPVGSMVFFGVAGGSGSRDEDNSPVGGSGTPHSAAHRVEDPATNEEGSESSPDEQVKRGKGRNWSKEEDEWLVSAWLNNSNDPIDGNSKKSDHFWKQIAQEYNMYAPQDQQKSAAQCKNHWTKNTAKVSKYACYNELKSTYASGQSEDQLMEKVREKYKVVAKTKRPFPFEHWWKMVKKQPKWRRLYTLEEMNKRNKLDAAGAYSSSNQETEAEEETKRPQGQKAAKAQRKGKSECSTGTLSNENVEQFNNLQVRKSITAEKMATAALLYAENEKERIEAEKEKTKVAKLDKYFNLIEKDTSDFTDDEKLRHERLVAYLAKELGLD